MECTVHWDQHTTMTFIAETGSGHIVSMDGATEGGGRNLAPRPMELLLAGAAGCTAYDVVLILQRGRAAIKHCTVSVKAERADTDPKVFTRIQLHFRVSGRHLKVDQVERAIQLSREKYCSATAMLAHSAEIVTSLEIAEVS